MGIPSDLCRRDPLAVPFDTLVASGPDGLEQNLSAPGCAAGPPRLQAEPWNAAARTPGELRRPDASADLQDPGLAPSPIRQAPAALPPLPPQPRSAGSALTGTAIAGVAVGVWRALDPIAGSSTTPLRRLWLYDPSGSGATSTAALAALDTVVVTHGWRGSGVSTAPGDPTGFGASFTAMASAIANPGKVQVLFLDWGPESIDPTPSGLAPYGAAGRVKAVANWASQQLQPLASTGKLLTLSGHSLGAYVSAQTALALGSATNLRLVALDPAAAGLNGAYDLESTNKIADPVPKLSATVAAGASLAFVVADVNLTIGIAGDNAEAGTAGQSFVVKGFASTTSAGDAHGAIPSLYADLGRYLSPNSSVTDGILASFLANRYSDSGSTSGTLRHEGVANLRSNSLGLIASLDGFSAGGGTQKVSFVEAGIADPAGSSTSQDTIVSLRDVALSSSANIEKVVLGGRSGLMATGNGLAQTLIGNEASNRLEGGGAVDLLTGGDGMDTFAYSTLLDGLIGGTSLAPVFERISDFDLLNDRIDAPGTSPRAVVGLGSLGATLSTSAINTLLSSTNFVASGAAWFSYGNRTFLAINDAIAGFNPAQDAVVELTGAIPNGQSLSNLMIA